MIGYIEGYSETSIICYCTACGAKISTWYADGTASCDNCGMRFGVVEKDTGEARDDG